MSKDNIPTFTINLDEKCVRCHKGGATKNGLCLKCIRKALKNGEYDHVLEECRKEAKDKLKRSLK